MVVIYSAIAAIDSEKGNPDVFENNIGDYPVYSDLFSAGIRLEGWLNDYPGDDDRGCDFS